jgi:hypothetical protein
MSPRHNATYFISLLFVSIAAHVNGSLLLTLLFSSLSTIDLVSTSWSINNHVSAWTWDKSEQAYHTIPVVSVVGLVLACVTRSRHDTTPVAVACLTTSPLPVDDDDDDDDATTSIDEDIED